MNTAFLALAGLVFVPALMRAESTAHSSSDSLSAKKSLSLLIAGNQRYTANHLSHPHQTPRYRLRLQDGQHPFACILSCSDSRVPPEIIFDEGLGDLFVIRVAGNIVDDAVTGSVEYAAEHLGVPLVIVLGHSKCGAVKAALAGGEPKTHIQSLVDAIMPAVNQAHHESGNLEDNAVRDNVMLSVKHLRESHPILAPMIGQKKVEVRGAIYDLSTGKVSFLKD